MRYIISPGVEQDPLGISNRCFASSVDLVKPPLIAQRSLFGVICIPTTSCQPRQRLLELRLHAMTCPLYLSLVHTIMKYDFGRLGVAFARGQ